MQIIVARHAGFCFGVERAIDIVKKASGENDNVVTFGPIIHNPQVVSDLASKGVSTIKSLNEVDNNMSVVIRSHGIEKKEALFLEERAGKVIDAACPFVQKAQKAAGELSKKCDFIVILGEQEHPEVKGIVSYIDIDYKVIEKAEEVENLPYKKTYGFLAQTTQNQEVFKNVEQLLRNKCDELIVAKTICSVSEHMVFATIKSSHFFLNIMQICFQVWRMWGLQRGLVLQSICLKRCVNIFMRSQNEQRKQTKRRTHGRF